MAEKKKKQKFYAVKEGFKKNVIVTTWDDCKELVDHYPGAKYHSFNSFQEAENYLGTKPIEKYVKPQKSNTINRPQRSKRGYRFEVWLSNVKIYEDMLEKCKRLGYTVDKAIEALINEWIY